MKGIRLTPLAQGDLDEIWDYVAEDDLVAAERLMDEIHGQLRTLAQFPESGRQAEDIAPQLRIVPVRRYLILYRVKKKWVEVARVVHGARDVVRLFVHEGLAE